MFEVRFPRDVRKYKEKIIAGLTLRQLVFGGLAIVTSVPTYIFGRKIMPEDLIALIAMILGGGLFFIGYGSFDGLTVDKYIKAFWESNIKKPPKRYFIRRPLPDILKDERCEEIRQKLKEIDQQLEIMKKK